MDRLENKVAIITGAGRGRRGHRLCRRPKLSGRSKRDGRAIRAYGRIDILVNNAARFGTGKRLADMDPNDWDDVMRVNLRGPFLCSKYALPHMQR